MNLSVYLRLSIIIVGQHTVCGAQCTGFPVSGPRFDAPDGSHSSPVSRAILTIPSLGELGLPNSNNTQLAALTLALLPLTTHPYIWVESVLECMHHQYHCSAGCCSRCRVVRPPSVMIKSHSAHMSGHAVHTHVASTTQWAALALVLPFMHRG